VTFTLAQLAQLEKGPTFKGYVITNLLRMNPLMQVLPFENVSTLRTVAIRWRTLPTVAFRQIGAGYTANEGQFEQVWESVYGFGRKIAAELKSCGMPGGPSISSYQRLQALAA
jgi:hypothetical protein